MRFFIVLCVLCVLAGPAIAGECVIVERVEGEFAVLESGGRLWAQRMTVEPQDRWVEGLVVSGDKRCGAQLRLEVSRLLERLSGGACLDLGDRQ